MKHVKVYSKQEVSIKELTLQDNIKRLSKNEKKENFRVIVSKLDLSDYKTGRLKIETGLTLYLKI